MPDTTTNTNTVEDKNGIVAEIQHSGGTVFAGDLEQLSVERNNNTDNVILDSSNSHLENLSTETLLEKRKALLWMANSGAAMQETVSFSQNELGKIEAELNSRGVTLK